MQEEQYFELEDLDRRALILQSRASDLSFCYGKGGVCSLYLDVKGICNKQSASNSRNWWECVCKIFAAAVSLEGIEDAILMEFL